MTSHNSEDYRFNLNRLHLTHDAVGEEFYDDEIPPAPGHTSRDCIDGDVPGVDCSCKPTCSHPGPCMVGWDLLGAEVCTIPTPDPYLRSHDA